MDSLRIVNKMEHLTKEEVPELPIDVMLDILSRLPAKTLPKLRCVSKLWRDYLSDPYFFQLHHHQSQKKPFFFFMGLLCNFGPGPQNYDPDVEFDATVHLSSADNEGQAMNEFTKQVKVDVLQDVKLLPSSNLICLASTNHIYICNPSIEEFLELPKGLPFQSHGCQVGFGYIPSTKEYKVVRLFYRHLDRDDPNNCVIGCEVLTISTSMSYLSGCCSSWRVLEEDCPYHTEHHKSSFVNGSVHWKIDSLCDKNGEDECILSFDLEAEKFWILPVPPCDKVGIEFELVEIGGNLWLAHYEDDPLILNMWTLKDWDKYEWVKVYRIDLATIDGCNTIRYRCSRGYPLDIQNEEILIETSGGRMDYYNIKTKTFTQLGFVKDRFQLCYYRDSFFSLGSF